MASSPSGVSKFTFQQRMLIGGVIAAGVGIFIMLISIATDYWVEIIIPDGQWRNRSQAFVVKHHSGLWRICRTEEDRSTEPHIESKGTMR